LIFEDFFPQIHPNSAEKFIDLVIGPERSASYESMTASL
jgi:hypothetical protein